jgi:hypothetical protein
MKLNEVYGMNKKQLLLNLTNILKFDIKNVKKEKKTSNFFSYLDMLKNTSKQVLLLDSVSIT